MRMFYFEDLTVCSFGGSVLHIAIAAFSWLSDWEIPKPVCGAYKQKGVENLYHWQAAAIEEGCYGENLVFTAPTSGGKSLVAEVLMIRRIVQSMKMVKRRRVYGRCLFVLPYVSIVMEKSEHLQTVLSPINCKVKGFFGGESGAILAPRGESVAVCTMEKANMAINQLLQSGRINELTCIVVDEAHMLGDTKRGSALELALTKILYACNKCQIIAMSATMGGLEVLRQWLRARLFVTNYRPVPLTQHAVYQGKVYAMKTGSKDDSTQDWRDELSLFEELRELPESTVLDRDRLVPLVVEALNRRESVLIFCSSRKQCESCAKMIAEVLPEFMSGGPQQGSQEFENRHALVQKLQDALAGYRNTMMEDLVMSGVAYHHAGLTKEERVCVENGFRDLTVMAMTATTTLAAGVNLPAHRVILRSLRQGREIVGRGQYLQMVGRAGRAGHTAKGESFLIGSFPGDPKAMGQLLFAPLPRLTSRLLPGDPGKSQINGINDLDEGDSEQIQRILLEGIASGAVRSADDIARLIQATFVCHQVPYSFLHSATKQAIEILYKLDMIEWVEEVHEETSEQEKYWQTTVRGNAVYASSLPLEDSLKLFDSLKAVRSCVVMCEMVHLIYIVLLDHAFKINDWDWWSSTFARLTPAKRRVADLLDVHDHHIQQRIGGWTLHQDIQARHTRFAVACALADLIESGETREVAEQWGKPNKLAYDGISPGQLQNIQTDVAKWAAMAALMCGAADWWGLEIILNQLSQQATIGGTSDIANLMQLEGMTPARARQLHKRGIKTIEALVNAPIKTVEKALAGALPMRSTIRNSDKDDRLKVGLTGESGLNALVARAASSLVLKACSFLVKQAKIADEQAEHLLQDARNEILK